jgi:hypothetical protein
MFDRSSWQKEYRQKTDNKHTKVYEKTIKGFLMRLYRNMQSRIDGVQKEKHKLYRGKELLDRESFYWWALGSPEFYQLFGEYKASGYERALAPSVDRVDSRQGYNINNMEWVTMSENSRRGAVSRHSK